MTIGDVIYRARNSSFNMANYSVNISIYDFVGQIKLHTHYRTDVVDSMWIGYVTPEFQRANNKWSEKMQVKFIENLLSGVKTELLFFILNDCDEAKVIDGLQRCTAIMAFISGKIKAFGYYYHEYGDLIKHFRTSIAIRIYDFCEWDQVGCFYVEMNENITHSKEDIQKAKDWFNKKHGIIL